MCLKSSTPGGPSCLCAHNYQKQAQKLLVLLALFFYETMTSEKSCHSPDNRYSSDHCSWVGKLIRPGKRGQARLKMLLCVFVMVFFIPLAAHAGEIYHHGKGVYSLLRMAATGTDESDTVVQLMTALSVFAVVGIVAQRCARYFQRRRLRRPFHIWGLW